MNVYKALGNYGQSVWLGFLNDEFIENETLEKLVDKNFLKGLVFDNLPLIKDLSFSHQYDNDLDFLFAHYKNENIGFIYRKIVYKQIQKAADIFKPLYERSLGKDGFIVFPVPANTALNPAEITKTVKDAWKLIDRPNLMIALPATPQVISVMPYLLMYNINIALEMVYSPQQYKDIVNAYVKGLQGSPKPANVSSVVSFAITPVENAVKNFLEKNAPNLKLPADHSIAVINASCAYQHFSDFFYGDQFVTLADQGCKTQRLMWVDTDSSQNDRPQTYFPENLIARDTISLMNINQYKNFKKFGVARPSLEKEYENAKMILQKLQDTGFDLETTAQELQQKALAAAHNNYEKALNALKAKRKKQVA